MDWEALFEASSDATRANFAAVSAALEHRRLKGSSNEEIAEKIGFGDPNEITDQFSGKPVLQYLLQVSI